MKYFLFAFLLLLSACNQEVAQKETGMERVLRTGTLRCGYYIYPPITKRDPNSNELSGMSVDMMNAIGAAAGLKVEWSEEINFGNWSAALQANRFDAVCTPLWPDIPLGRIAGFSVPFMYAGLSPMVRADDTRFKDNDLARLNRPDIKFIAQDGNALVAVTKAAFDKAQIVSIAANVDGATVPQEIINKKADAMLGDYNNIIQLNQWNSVKLRLVAPNKPVKVQAFSIGVNYADVELRQFFDNAILTMLNDGSIDRLIDKWQPAPSAFLRVAKPYEVTK